MEKESKQPTRTHPWQRYNLDQGERAGLVVDGAGG